MDRGLWHCIGDRDQDHPQEKEKRKKKNGCLRRPYKAVKTREVKSKGEKKRYTPWNAKFQRIARRDKKAFLSDQCKEIEENNRMGRLEISSRKLEILREYFSCVVGRGYLLWPVHFLGKTVLVFTLLHSIFQGQICLLPQVFLDFLLLHSSPL